MRFSRLLIPRIEKRWWPLLLKSALIGAVIAGVYGIIHDQITFSISEKYFTEFKFDQFAWANPKLENQRIFVGLIGFLATWWVGGIAGWALARLGVSYVSRYPDTIAKLTVNRVVSHFSLILIFSMLFGVLGFLSNEMMSRPPENRAFYQVGAIHNGGYLGALAGLVIAAIRFRRSLLKEHRF